MDHHSTITVKQHLLPLDLQQTYSTALSSVRDISNDESKGLHLLTGECSSAYSFLHVETESHRSPSPQQASLFQQHKSSSNSESSSPMSDSSHPQHPRSMFSRSSTFCTSLYSSTSTETYQQLRNLPFLPHPPKYNQTIPSVHSSKSPLLFNVGSSIEFAEECSRHVRKEFNNLPADALDGNFHCETNGSNSLTPTEQLELQFLSDELDIAITDNSANPRIDDIYEVYQVSSAPSVESKCNKNHLHPPVPPVDNQIHSCQPSSANAPSHKPRMRWTPELHECFLEALKIFDGAEKATPKGILKLMNIEGLTIYHVKSHLQKYRLAKYMPEKIEDKKSACSEENEEKATLNDNEGDAQSKRFQVTEALRMQMDVQKQLHEQLEVQRALQLRIEEHARYLDKMVEEQEKSRNTFTSALSKPLLADARTDAEPTPAQPLSQSDSRSYTFSSLRSKRKGIYCTEMEAAETTPEGWETERRNVKD